MPGLMPCSRSLTSAGRSAAKLAGVSAFDVYLVTHYDVDHSGNVPNIAGRFPAKLFVDHGPWLDNPKLGAMNKNAGDAYLAFVAAFLCRIENVLCHLIFLSRLDSFES